MSIWNDYVVEYKVGNSWVVLNDVQSLFCSVGRQNITDLWGPSRCSITSWYPNGFSSPANLSIDQLIRFKFPGETYVAWSGKIANIKIEYGKMYDSTSGVGINDFLQIDALGFGDTNGRVFKGWSTLDSDELDAFMINEGLSTTSPFSTSPNPASNNDWYPYDNMGVTTAIAPGPLEEIGYLEVLQGAATFSYSRYLDDAGFWPGRLLKSDISSVQFSDTTNNSTNRIYDEVVFSSLGDEYFDSVNFRAGAPDFIGGSPAEIQSSGFPSRIWRASVYGRGSTLYGPQIPVETLMQNSADYWANILSEQTIAPKSISALMSAQQTKNLHSLGFTDLPLSNLCMKAIRMNFRNEIYALRIEGVSVTATQSDTRFTYYLSPASQSAWLILDEDNFGVLDQNRLALY